MIKRLVYLLVLAACWLLPFNASAIILNFTAQIDGAQANAGLGTGSPGTATASIQFDSQSSQLSWNIAWSNLESNVTVAHFHGPAGPASSAGVQVAIPVSTNPAIGSASLNTAQVQQLFSGQLYINIHSALHPGGEIRGQVLPVPVSTSSFTLKSGRWESLVVPANPAGATIQDIFADELGVAGYATSWIVYTFNESTQSYDQPGLTGVLKQGQAFWIIQTTGADIQISAGNSLPHAEVTTSQNCASPDGCLLIPLPANSGQRQLAFAGSPYDMPLDIAEIRISTEAIIGICTRGCDLDLATEAELIAGNLYVYDSANGIYSRPGTESSLTAWQGFWIELLPVPEGTNPSLLLPASPAELPQSAM